MPKIATKWQRFEALTAAALYELLRFRQDIFVVEQRSPYPDLDGLDQSAWHLLWRVDAQLYGYLRLMPIPGPPPVVRIGRVAPIWLHNDFHVSSSQSTSTASTDISSIICGSPSGCAFQPMRRKRGSHQDSSTIEKPVSR